MSISTRTTQYLTNAIADLAAAKEILVALNDALTAIGEVVNPEIKNTVYAGPVSGVPVDPTFRTLVAADLPALPLVTQIGSNHITFGSAPPATGTWAQGDVTFNTGAAAGTPAGWSCSAAGTPGTWKAWANLV